MRSKTKKAYFFSLDALIALIVIVTVILVAVPIVRQRTLEMNIQEDVMESFSNIKIGDLDNGYSAQLISQRKITNLEQSALEQIGEFYAKEMPEAQLLADSIFADMNIKENIGIWFNNQLIAARNSTPFETSERVWTSREVISGIEKGKDIKGYSSRAYLTNANRISYFYFGGYIGDGNITAEMNYSGSIKNAKIEVAINKEFDLYINDIFSGHYGNSSSSTTPAVYDIDAYLSNFHHGKNTIKFSGSSLYIAGGYLKISYNSSEQYHFPERHYFPGIEGTINLYDSFYVPGALNSMSASLHYKSPYKMFLNIGNLTVFNSSSSSETTEVIENSYLSSVLNYPQLSKKTIPIRLGLQGISGVTGGNADVVLITDLSGSMDYRMNSDNSGIARNCDSPQLYNSDTKRVSLAKCLDKQVVDKILNVSGNQVALSAFYADETNPYKGRVYEEDLTSNKDYLKSKIDIYSPQGGTCICCAINDAYKILNEQSNSSRQRFIIVMSDGIPTHSCQAASGCEGTRTGLPSDEGLWLGWGAGCYGGSDDCNVNDCSCASQNANWSSCRAYNNLNAKIYSIGFGPVSACIMANTTLRNIAQCGEGNYYASDNASMLQEIYSTISQEITALSYTEQISQAIGLNQTTLYPDSYIYFNYSSASVPYGTLLTIQTDEFGNLITEGEFFIPGDAEILDANVISYSGSKWTDYVYVNKTNWTSVFSLADYGTNYLLLGDAYPISIPIEYLAKGNNTVKITTSLGGNSSGGSASDKAVYTIVRPASGYSKISSSALGCRWTIEFEDSSNITLNIPANYSESNVCYYTSSLISYNNNDAIDNALFSLLSQLDLNSNKKIETKFSDQDLQITSNEVSGIPYTWNSEVQVRVWK
jgi:hypothetical protein